MGRKRGPDYRTCGLALALDDRRHTESAMSTVGGSVREEFGWCRSGVVTAYVKRLVDAYPVSPMSTAYLSPPIGCTAIASMLSLSSLALPPLRWRAIESPLNHKWCAVPGSTRRRAASETRFSGGQAVGGRAVGPIPFAGRQYRLNLAIRLSEEDSRPETDVAYATAPGLRASFRERSTSSSGTLRTPPRSRRLVVQLSALRARPGSGPATPRWARWTWPAKRVGAARSGLDGARRGALQGDQLTGRVLDRTSTTEARCQSDAAIATPIKAAPRPARRLRATFAAARKREPSLARRCVSYPKVL
jgi:hypothetical protein